MKLPERFYTRLTPQILEHRNSLVKVLYGEVTWKCPSRNDSEACEKVSATPNQKEKGVAEGYFQSSF